MAVAKEIRRFHGIFHGLISRCNNRANASYPRYGGRGIKSEWTGMQFKKFKEEMYQSYTEHVKKYGEKNTTIERINYDGNYSAANCRWATWKEQANNKNGNVLLTLKNETMTLMQWSEKTNIPYHVIHIRIYGMGWSIERALTEQVENHKTYLTYKNKTLSINEWSKKVGLSPGVISGRRQKGESIERILRPISKLKSIQINGKKYTAKQLSIFLNREISLCYKYIKAKKLPKTLRTY